MSPGWSSGGASGHPLPKPGFGAWLPVRPAPGGLAAWSHPTDKIRAPPLGRGRGRGGAQMPAALEAVRLTDRALPGAGHALLGWSASIPVLGLDPRSEKAAGLLSAPKQCTGRVDGRTLLLNQGHGSCEGNALKLTDGPASGAGQVNPCAVGAAHMVRLHLLHNPSTRLTGL
jgi:hypothetical protein